MTNIKEYRAKKEGKVTPESLTAQLLEEVKKSDVEIESLVYVVKFSDGTISTGWSQMTLLESLGLITCGQQEIMEDMRTE